MALKLDPWPKGEMSKPLRDGMDGWMDDEGGEVETYH